MSNNNFNYLRFEQNVNVPNISNKSYESDNKKIMNQVKKSINKFKNLSGSKNTYNTFKKKLQLELIENVEKQFIIEIQRIKSTRSKEEYISDLNRIMQAIVKDRIETEKSLINVKKYLDYMELKNETKPRLLLPGLESETKLEPLILPDLLGFTKSKVQRETYGDLIMNMVQSFLGFTTTLYDAMKQLLEYIKNPEISTDTLSIKLDEKLKLQSMKPLRKLKIYYNLLRMLEIGKFNLNDIINTKEKEEDYRFKNEPIKTSFGDKRDKRDRGDRRGKKFDKKSFKGKKRFRGGEGNVPFGQMINYILSKELPGEDFLEINKKFQRELKEGGLQILKKYVINDSSSNSDSYNFIVKPENKCLAKYKATDFSSTSCDGPAKTIGNLFEKNSLLKLQAEKNLNKDKIELADFYNGEDFSLAIGKTPEGNSETNGYRMFFMTYIGYEKYYSNYQLEKLLKPITGLESFMDGLRIVNGLGIYLTVTLELITKLESKLLGFEEVIKPQVKNTRRNEEQLREKKIVDEKLLELQTFLREIDSQILKLKKSNDPNKVEKIRKIMEIRNKLSASH